MTDAGPLSRRAGPPGPPAIVWSMAAAMIGFELIFQLADAGLLPRLLRFAAYEHFAFWDVYLEAVREGARVPALFWITPVTYGFLHGGPMHLIMNGVILLGLGGILARLLGTARFLVLFAVTAAGGALVFGLITDSQGPLVGASGAIFGFFGALKRWEWKYIRATGAPSNRFWGTIGALVAINVILYLTLTGSALAWEAHLGGFVAGYLIAPLLAPRLAAPSPI